MARFVGEIGRLTRNQLTRILGPDPSHFETLISHLMSSSKEQRSQAESVFNLYIEERPDSLALKLVQSLNPSLNLELRAMSAVLLRKQLTRGSAFIYSRIREPTRSTLKSLLISSIQQESTKSIAKKVCDTISELASAILPENGWPELLPFMFECVHAADNPTLQEYALLIFSRLAQYSGETLIPHLITLHPALSQCLTSPDLSLRIAAFDATTKLILCSNHSDLDKDIYLDLLPPMMQTLTEALSSGQEATAQEALQLLIELAGTEPLFLRNQSVEIVRSMLQIAETKRLEEGTRHLAIEFVITLAEARERAPVMIRKLLQFLTKIFIVLMNMLLDIEDDPAWHSAKIEDKVAGETSNFGFGRECLSRLAISLGGNSLFRVASDVFLRFFKSSDWRKHHAALIALAVIAEGCSEVMKRNLKRNLKPVVSMIRYSLRRDHPRVRWAAINAIGQLSVDLGPVLAKIYNHSLLVALAGALDDFEYPRVQIQAAYALLNFRENCMHFERYEYGLIDKLYVLSESEKRRVRKAAYTAMHGL